MNKKIYIFNTGIIKKININDFFVSAIAKKNKIGVTYVIPAAVATSAIYHITTAIANYNKARGIFAPYLIVTIKYNPAYFGYPANYVIRVKKGGCN